MIFDRITVEFCDFEVGIDILSFRNCGGRGGNGGTTDHMLSTCFEDVEK